MANQYRGEVELVGTSGKSYQFKLGSEAICRLMDEFDEPTDAALFSRLSRELSPEGVSGVNTRILRSVVKACVDAEDPYAVLDDNTDVAVIEALVKVVNGRVGINPRKPTQKKKGGSSGQTDSSEPPK